MRLKSFQAPTMAEAMELVRETLGADAIIVSTNEDEASSEVRITAAVEQDEPDRVTVSDPPADLIDVIGEALDTHALPQPLTDRILNSVSLLGEQAPAVALSSALDLVFTFNPVTSEVPRKPLMFIGPPGAGKTVSIAKVAADALIDHRTVKLITTDTLRAGAVEQFRSYGKRLGVIPAIADDAATLKEFLSEAGPNDTILIDTTSINPFAEEDAARMQRMVDAASAEAVLVLPAIADTHEARALTRAFTQWEPRRLMITGLDYASRFGAMLSVAHENQLALSEIGTSPAIVDGLKALNPVSLAQILLAPTVRDAFAAKPTDEHRQASGQE